MTKTEKKGQTSFYVKRSTIPKSYDQTKGPEIHDYGNIKDVLLNAPPKGE